MHTVNVPGIEHIYSFRRDSPSSGHKIAMLNPGSPLKDKETWLEELLGKVVNTGRISCTADFGENGVRGMTPTLQ